MTATKGHSLRTGHRELAAGRAAQMISGGMEIQALAMALEQKLYNPSPELDSLIEYMQAATEDMVRMINRLKQIRAHAHEITSAVEQARFVAAEVEA